MVYYNKEVKDLLINKNSSEPVYLQVVNQYKRQIATKTLVANDKLCSVRQLSYEIGINPNTLQKAYTQLESMGICYSVPGRGRFVSENARDIIMQDVGQHYIALDKAIEELAMCNIDIEDIIKKARNSYQLSINNMKGTNIW